MANPVDEAVWSVTAMQTTWILSLALVILRATTPTRFCKQPSSLNWFYTRITGVTACPVLADMLR